MTKFPTYKSIEYRTIKTVRKERKERIKLSTERIDYETSNQESFFSSKKKEIR